MPAMWLLLCSLALQPYADRLRELNEAIVAERHKAAEGLEAIQAWRWARAEYRKIARLDPNDAGAKRKLDGAEALPADNAKTTAESAARYAQLLADVGKVAADGHAALAQWCAANGHATEASRHWRLALFYTPLRDEALGALGFVGSGAAAVDPAWKGIKWKDLLTKADAGSEGGGASDLETKWKVKPTKRTSPSFAWEGYDVDADHLKRLARQAEASVAFMRIALGDTAAKPCVGRIVVMTGQGRFHRYIDDFVTADDRKKKLLKKTGGLENLDRDEWVQFAFDTGSDWHDHVVAHSVGEFVLASALGKKDYDDMPAWIKEAVGCLCDLLFRGSVKASCIEVPTGTGSGDVPWTDATRWDEGLKGLMQRGRDPELGDVLAVTLNAMKGDQRAKAASVVRMLMLRWPEGFRAIVAELRKNAADSRGAVEAALGIPIEELDEFWRRWLRAY
jgi:hypothetical protein